MPLDQHDNDSGTISAHLSSYFYWKRQSSSRIFYCIFLRQNLQRYSNKTSSLEKATKLQWQQKL